MKEKLVIFGTGLFAEVVHYYLSREEQYEVVAFTKDAPIDDDVFLGLPVVPFDSVESVYPPCEYKMFVAVGYRKVNQLRANIFDQVKKKGYSCITYISPDCTYHGKSIGENCFIMEDNTIQPFVEIGNNVILWSGNHVGHHSKIDDHCFIASHAVISGSVHVGEYSFIGVNATMKEAITIAPSCIIGAGSLIMKSTPERSVYVGVRSKKIHLTSDKLGV